MPTSYLYRQRFLFVVAWFDPQLIDWKFLLRGNMMHHHPRCPLPTSPTFLFMMTYFSPFPHRDARTVPEALLRLSLLVIIMSGYNELEIVICRSSNLVYEPASNYVQIRESTQRLKDTTSQRRHLKHHKATNRISKNDVQDSVTCDWHCDDSSADRIYCRFVWSEMTRRLKCQTNWPAGMRRCMGRLKVRCRW